MKLPDLPEPSSTYYCKDYPKKEVRAIQREAAIWALKKAAKRLEGSPASDDLLALIEEIE